jgi:hypothetical protein
VEDFGVGDREHAGDVFLRKIVRIGVEIGPEPPHG